MQSLKPDFLDSPYYLAHPDVMSHVVWKQMGRTNFLVTTASVQNAGPTEVAPVANADAGQSTSSDGDVADPSQFEAAELHCVATIGLEDCWLNPDGNFPIPGGATELAKVTLNCQAVSPPNSGKYAAPYTKSMAVLRGLADRVKTPGFSLKGMLDSKKPGFKLRHVPFRLPEDDSDKGCELEGLEDWPVKKQQGESAKIEMEGKYVVDRLCAYDLGGRIIAPEDYMSKLPGATVAATFTLTHFSFKNKGEDTIVADIVKLRVIESKIAAPSSPRKRRAVPEMDESPKKKRKA
ncbi:unnamed protein product [Mycena citricolor]|uniref:Uncharacterized protein n=1 Tax=Mycena citricolor TaxID=2018698 RepID=A0AAD2H1X6_9AGAR|nr:unnamed protein product [Mycena citricolor]